MAMNHSGRCVIPVEWMLKQCNPSCNSVGFF